MQRRDASRRWIGSRDQMYSVKAGTGRELRGMRAQSGNETEGFKKSEIENYCRRRVAKSN